MADYEISGPDGSTYKITAPEGATQDQVLEYAKKNFGGTLPSSVAPVAKDISALPPDQMNVLERIGSGVLDPAVGVRQLYAHAVGSPEYAKEIDKGVADRESDLRKRGAGEGDLARSMGRVIPAAVAGIAAGPIAGGVAGGALGGMATELLNPVSSEGSYVEKKLNQGLMGAAFGAGGSALTKGVGAIVGPTVREAAAELMKNGVQLTPGQIAGGIMRRAEEAAKSFPILGSFIRSSENRSIEGFNRAVINQALEPIGEKLPERSPVGREAISYAKARLEDSYDNLLPKMQLSLDQQLASDISNLRHSASMDLPKDQYGQFEKTIRERLQRYFNNTGSISGEELKKVERDLGAISRNYGASADPAQRDYARLVNDLRGNVRDALARQNPQEAAELQKINESYAMFTRVESAAARRVSSRGEKGEHGVFLPSDLLQSIKNADKTVRKGAFARGDALMQDFAEYADTVLPSKLPDSGTTERAMYDYMMTHGGGALATGATAALSTKLAAGGVALLPYTKIGQSAVNAVARPKGAARTAIGNSIKGASGVIGSSLEPIINGQSLDYLADRATK